MVVSYLSLLIIGLANDCRQTQNCQAWSTLVGMATCFDWYVMMLVVCTGDYTHASYINRIDIEPFS